MLKTFNNLHKVQSLDPQGSNDPIKVNFFRNPEDVKINNLTAYRSHPGKSSIFGTFMAVTEEYIFGRTTVLVKVNEEEAPLYMKIDELSAALGISTTQFKNLTYGKNDDEIVSFMKLEMMANQIAPHLLEGEFKAEEIRDNLSALLEREICPENIFALLNNPHFDSKKMVNTLMQIGDCLKNKKDLLLEPQKISSSPYQFAVRGKEIYVWKEDDISKVRINLKDLKEDIIVYPTDMKAFQRLVDSLGVDWHKNFNFFHNIADRMSFSTMLRIVEDFLDDVDKKIMVNTLISMGRKIENLEIGQVYEKCIKEKGEVKSHAFAISPEHLYIAISQRRGGYVAEGNFKIVTDAIKINNFSEKSFAEQVEEFVRIKPHPRPMKMPKEQVTKEVINIVNDELSNEADLLEEISKENEYIIDPYTLRLFSETGKIVLFQRKCSGDGEKLFNAPVHHKLKALVDFGKGIVGLHTKSLKAHTDIKPANLLLSGDVANPHASIQGKVGDLGLATPLGEKLRGGSGLYLPPESLTGPKHTTCNLESEVTEEIDSYSYGMTILQILTGKVPPHFGRYNDVQFQEEVNKYFKLVFAYLKCQPDQKTSLAMLNVSYNLIRYNPKDRLSCADAVATLEGIQSKEFTTSVAAA